MPNEKTIDEMNPTELRAEYDAYQRSLRPAPGPAPLAPGMQPSDKPEAIDLAASLYGQSLLDRQGGLSGDERDWLRQSLKAYQDSQE
jgi:hypothetical protein